MDPCPAEDALADLVAGSLSPAAGARLHQHIQACEPCQQALVALAESLPNGAGQEAPEAAPLLAGDRIGRFELLELIGAGSMGAVWSARDTELGRVVALKTLRAAHGDASVKRLFREAQSMARLQHPNVVTVFDVVTRGEQVFLAMELVDGGTLRAWLAARPRKLEEVLRVFALAGRGLAAAHAAGLVHRDFKPDNVLVSDDGRVRVTDFGLARPSGGAPPSAGSPEPAPESLDLTRSGAVVGTPAYMAPEQMRGEPIDARADVFGFCAALYESVNGERPFSGATLDELRRRAESNQVSPPPRGRRVPAWLRRVLLRGLRAAPAERWSSMEELLAELSRGRVRGARGPRWRKAAAAVLLVAGALASAAWLARGHAVASPGQRRSLAVLGPRNEGGGAETAWLSSALAEMLADELSAGEGVRLVPGRNVAQALADLGLIGATAEPGAGALQSLRDQLGADLIVDGWYRSPAAGKLQLALRVWDARTGEVAASADEEGEPERISELAGRAGLRLREGLKLAPPSRSQAAGGSFPRDPEAARLYAQAVAQLYSFEVRAALAGLLRAAARAPGNARIQAALARAHASLGETASARAAAERALAAGGLDREEHLKVERMARFPDGNDWRRALEISQALWTFFPDDVEYGLQLAADLTSATRYEEAFAVLAQARKLPAPVGQDPRLDVIEADTARLGGDLKRAAAAAARAIAGGRARGVRTVLAKGLYLQGEALRRLGDPTGAAASYNEAETLFGQLGDRRYAATASLMHGTLDADQGDLAGARARFESAIALYRELGNTSAEGAAQLNLSVLLRRMLLFEPALVAIERTRSLATELRQPVLISSALHARGTILEDQGDLAGATAAYEESRAVRSTQPGKPRLATSLAALAGVACERGELARARKLCDESGAEATEAAQQAEAPLCLARVELAAGNLGAADALAAKAAGLFAALKHVDPLALSHALRAEALLGQGRQADAEAEVAAATGPQAQKTSQVVRATLGITAARVQAAQPARLQDAIAALRAVVAEAQRSGTASDLLHARLALAELRETARAPGAGAELAEVSREAAARGFDLVASKARRGPPGRTAR